MRIRIPTGPHTHEYREVPDAMDACRHRGAEGERVRCPSCAGNVEIKTFACAVHGRCHLSPEKRLAGVQGCYDNCFDYESADTAPAPLSVFLPQESDVSVGLVVGTWGPQAAELAALQARLARYTSGTVPVLVADDASPGVVALTAAAAHESFHLWPSPVRAGHGAGDLSALWKGLVWARATGLRVLAKLSQRALPTRPRWLHDSATALLASGLPLATQPCRGRETFPFRSEVLILDVAAWTQPKILARLSPWPLTPQGVNAEKHLARVLSELGGRFLPLDWLNEDRYQKCDSLIWHNSHSPEDYRDLGRSLGLPTPLIDVQPYRDGYLAG